MIPAKRKLAFAETSHLSSVGQSNALVMRGSGVRIPEVAPLTFPGQNWGFFESRVFLVLLV